jgi:hypothetical protein
VARVRRQGRKAGRQEGQERQRLPLVHARPEPVDQPPRFAVWRSGHSFSEGGRTSENVRCLAAPHYARASRSRNHRRRAARPGRACGFLEEMRRAWDDFEPHFGEHAFDGVAVDVEHLFVALADNQQRPAMTQRIAEPARSGRPPRAPTARTLRGCWAAASSAAPPPCSRRTGAPAARAASVHVTPSCRKRRGATSGDRRTAWQGRRGPARRRYDDCVG